MSFKTSHEADPLSEVEFDQLVDQLTPVEIETLLEECDPDDPTIPPSLKCSYKCEKAPTGNIDHEKLLDFIKNQALNMPDIPEAVPYIPGTVRGKKWIPPAKPEPQDVHQSIELDLDLEEELENALAGAKASDIIDLAGILDIPSLMNQDQYHSVQSERLDHTICWNSVTKATPLKEFPPEETNRTDPDEVISKLVENNKTLSTVNLNNVCLTDDQFTELFSAVQDNEILKDLSLSNTGLTDAGAASLARALEFNRTLQKLNIESNCVSPQMLVKIFVAANAQQVLKELKVSNQKARYLGHKVEMAITKAVEANSTILKVGLHFEFGDCRNRIAVQLQKNLDRVRLNRIQRG